MRVAGSPDFIELLYDQKQTDARLSEAETPDKENFGIYSRQNAMKDVAVDDPEHSQRVDTGAPNISLNTSGSEISPQELRIIALIAVVLQAAVIVFDGIVTYQYRWQKNNHDVPGYAFPMAAIGTVAVSVGMFICAHLIEASTRESTWQPIDKDRNLQVLWLQRGQTVNDQRFKSYGIYAASTQKVIRTSRPSSKRGDLEGLTYVGTAISIIGGLNSLCSYYKPTYTLLRFHCAVYWVR